MGLEAKKITPRTILPVATIDASQRLIFETTEDQDRAWQIGVFYLRAPRSLELDKVRCFGEGLSFPDSPYREIPKYGELEGFISLENNQQTKLALQRHRWDEHYPPEIANFGRKLDEIGIGIVREVFRQSGIPKQHWGPASGGYAAGEGTAFLNFVHYDTRQPDLGLRPHTDYGFVTILDATAPGLQIEVDGSFMDVPVLEGHLVINFGEALNFITQRSDRTVSAIVHRVTTQSESRPVRHSVVYFANPYLDGYVHQYDSHGRLHRSSTVHQLFESLENKLTEDN
jgi:hypothetical protein